MSGKGDAAIAAQDDEDAGPRDAGPRDAGPGNARVAVLPGPAGGRRRRRHAGDAGASSRVERKTVRLSAEEVERMEAAWQQRGYASLSELLRDGALRLLDDGAGPAAVAGVRRLHVDPVVLDRLHDLADQLRRVGNNVNQIAMNLHRARIAGKPLDDALKPEDLQVALEAVGETERGVRELVARLVVESAARSGRKPSSGAGT